MFLAFVSLASILALQPSGATDLTVHQVNSVDEREIVFYVDRPAADGAMPLLVMVDGSGCVGQRRPAFESLYAPGADQEYRFARLRVEKPGVDASASGEPCSETFLRHYSIDDRVTDHLRVLQHLSATADRWDGTLYIWGWSDGADIAAQIAIYRSDVDRMILGAVGGGLTFTELFEDYWACRADQMAEAAREQCVNGLRAQFTEIENNPTWQETWGGEDNSWRVWESRLRSRLIDPLSDHQSPFLIVHGSQDYDSVPVESARRLVEGLEANENNHFEYWEIACMEHVWRNMSEVDGASLETSMLNWLFGDPDPAPHHLLDPTHSRPSTRPMRAEAPICEPSAN
ncbi:alpha/beta hydrolase family protein [Maricaulis sp.]|uniref:alpha/beta hydrolase family protein n=1 Tax=Maricaulis sp. TaxID=1486257 RepID=UPI003A90F5CF